MLPELFDPLVTTSYRLRLGPIDIDPQYVDSTVVRFEIEVSLFNREYFVFQVVYEVWICPALECYREIIPQRFCGLVMSEVVYILSHKDYPSNMSSSTYYPLSSQNPAYFFLCLGECGRVFISSVIAHSVAVAEVPVLALKTHPEMEKWW